MWVYLILRVSCTGLDSLRNTHLVLTTTTKKLLLKFLISPVFIIQVEKNCAFYQATQHEQKLHYVISSFVILLNLL